MRPRRAQAQMSRHLTMARMAKLLGWVGPTGEPTRNDLDRLRRRLRRVERETGRRILFGGGRRGKRGGGRCWTTWQAIRGAGLVDDVAILDEMARQHLADLRDEVVHHGELIDLLDHRQRASTVVLREVQENVREIAGIIKN